MVGWSVGKLISIVLYFCFVFSDNTGVQAAAKRFEERSQHGRNVDEDTKQAREERKKQRRDEMAARHLRRERFREVVSKYGQYFVIVPLF